LSEPFAIGDERLGKDLDRDIAAKTRVVGPINLAHATGTKQRFNLVNAESTTDQRHGLARF
jgi:hypothetical protein